MKCKGGAGQCTWMAHRWRGGCRAGSRVGRQVVGGWSLCGGKTEGRSRGGTGGAARGPKGVSVCLGLSREGRSALENRRRSKEGGTQGGGKEGSLWARNGSKRDAGQRLEATGWGRGKDGTVLRGLFVGSTRTEGRPPGEKRARRRRRARSGRGARARAAGSAGLWAAPPQMQRMKAPSAPCSATAAADPPCAAPSGGARGRAMRSPAARATCSTLS